MEFTKVTLGDISKGKGQYGIGASAVEYSEDLYTYLRITDINDDGTLNYSDLKSVNDEKASQYVLEPNDIVFARTGNSTGRNYFYDGTDGTFVYAGFLIKFSIDPDKVNPKYIKYYCLSNAYKGWVQGHSTGSTRGNINAQTYANMEIVLPPRGQQDKMVSILENLELKRKNNNAINRNLQEQAQAVYQEWFVEGARYEKDVNGEFIGVSKVSLADLMDYAGGSQPPASEFIEEEREGYVRFVQIRDYDTDSHITYIPVSPRNKLCNKYDIMIARYGAALGRICFGLDGAYNVALAKVFPKKSYYQEFLRSYLSSVDFYEGINIRGGRSAQSGFNQSDIKSFRLLFPDDDTILKEYEELVKPIIDARLKIKEENYKLAHLRDTILPKLMSGELDVSGFDI